MLMVRNAEFRAEHAKLSFLSVLKSDDKHLVARFNRNYVYNRIWDHDNNGEQKPPEIVFEETFKETFKNFRGGLDFGHLKIFAPQR